MMSKKNFNDLMTLGLFLAVFGGAFGFVGYAAKNSSNVIKGIKSVSLGHN